MSTPDIEDLRATEIDPLLGGDPLRAPLPVSVHWDDEGVHAVNATELVAWEPTRTMPKLISIFPILSGKVVRVAAGYVMSPQSWYI